MEEVRSTYGGKWKDWLNIVDQICCWVLLSNLFGEVLGKKEGKTYNNCKYGTCGDRTYATNERMFKQEIRGGIPPIM